MRGLVHGVEVNGDAESHADLISPGVASSDGPRGIVYFVGDAVPGQGFRYPKSIKQIQNTIMENPSVISVLPYKLRKLIKGTKTGK